MGNCLICGKCGRDQKDNAVCNVSEDKSVQILAFKDYDNEPDFRRALYEVCGTNCDKFEPKVKKKGKEKKQTVEKVKAPSPPHVGMVKTLLGCTAVLLGVLIPVYLYFLLT